jgi:hypothetical protein
MKTKKPAVIAVLILLAAPLAAQKTPESLVRAYDSLADTILSVRDAELGFVAAMLDGHLHAAKALMSQGKWEQAAGEMALFANEGDNAIGGVRKKLLEGGHHFNAAGEEQGIFEDGYVIVTRKAKQTLLAASKELRLADGEVERMAAWDKFKTTAKGLLEAAAKDLGDG